MLRRRHLIPLLALPLIQITTACSGQGTPTDHPSPASSPVITAAEREWLLSSPDQQDDYCTDYIAGDQSLNSVRYYGFGDDDADQEFVEEFLELLKKKC